MWELNKIGLVLSTLILMGCESTSDLGKPEKSIESAASFSVQGKTMKSVSAPNGDHDIYDISADMEVRAAIHRLYRFGAATYGDVTFRYGWGEFYTPPEIKANSDVQLLIAARKIAEYDLYRLGCRTVVRTPCGNGISGFNPKYYSECPSCNLGKLPDSTERISYSYNRTAEKVMTPEYIDRGRWGRPENEFGFAHVDECKDESNEPVLKWMYLGPRSEIPLATTESYLTNIYCADWKNVQ